MKIGSERVKKRRSVFPKRGLLRFRKFKKEKGERLYGKVFPREIFVMLSGQPFAFSINFVVEWSGTKGMNEISVPAFRRASRSSGSRVSIV